MSTALGCFLAGDILNVRWGYSDSTEEHTGYLPLDFMKKHSYSASALRRRRNDRPVVAVSALCNLCVLF